MIRLLLYMFIWVTSMAIAIFATQNTYLVSLRLLTFESIKFPLGLVIIFCGGLGAIFITILQNQISFDLPTMPNFSGFAPKESYFKNQTSTQKSTTKKDIAKPNQKNKNDFDEDWDEDWG